jgi:hypothetical protein
MNHWERKKNGRAIIFMPNGLSDTSDPMAGKYNTSAG